MEQILTSRTQYVSIGNLSSGSIYTVAVQAQTTTLKERWTATVAESSDLDEPNYQIPQTHPEMLRQVRLADPRFLFGKAAKWLDISFDAVANHNPVGKVHQLIRGCYADTTSRGHHVHAPNKEWIHRSSQTKNGRALKKSLLQSSGASTMYSASSYMWTKSSKRATTTWMYCTCVLLLHPKILYSYICHNNLIDAVKKAGGR